jgi:hypothetical protein
MTLVLTILLAWAQVGHAGSDGASTVSSLPAGNGGHSAAPDSADPAGVAGKVRAALRAGDYPWYDANSGKVRALSSRKPRWTKELFDRIERLGKRLQTALEGAGKFLSRFLPGRGPGLAASGDVLMATLLWVALAGLVVALVRLWYRRQQLASARSPDRVVPGRGTLLAELAGAEGQTNVDPWSEALRRRASGDLAGAVVYLFIHLLLALDQIGFIRLAPGMTGRQYVAGLADANLRHSLGATLGLFEEVHYGHRRPGEAAFEAAWNQAVAFRREVLGQIDGR